MEAQQGPRLQVRETRWAAFPWSPETLTVAPPAPPGPGPASGSPSTLQHQRISAPRPVPRLLSQPWGQALVGLRMCPPRPQQAVRAAA